MVKEKLQLWLGWAVEKYLKWRHRKSLKRAIKLANHVRFTTGYKCIVFFVGGKYRAYTKQSLKAVCQSKTLFKKGTTVQQLERMAVYTTQ